MNHEDSKKVHRCMESDNQRDQNLHRFHLKKTCIYKLFPQRLLLCKSTKPV